MSYDITLCMPKEQLDICKGCRRNLLTIDKTLLPKYISQTNFEPKKSEIQGYHCDGEWSK